MADGRPAHPNVVVFLTDQQRHDSTGAHGNPLDLTPNFDRVAAEGTFVANGFTCQPVCTPTRAELQTGRYGTTTGVYRNGIALPTDARTLAHHFADGGFDTAYVGKWHLAETRTEPVPRELRGGYDHWLASDVLEFTSDAYDTLMYDGDDNPVHLPGYRADAVTDAAIDYLARPHDRPFFLFVSLIEPHHQNSRDDYPAPTGYRERYEGRWVPPDLAALGGSAHGQLGGYWGMVKRIDEAFGRLLDAIESLGLTDDTVVAFGSDHGCHFKTRNSEYKRSPHDASIHVPLALRGPGFDGGGRLPELVGLIDLPPTLLDAAGLPVPDEMQGRSFLPLASSRGDDWQQEVFVQISESQVGRAIRTSRWMYAVTAPDKDAWDDAGSERYVEAELYDLYADPYELNNLAGSAQHREIADGLRDRLIARMVAAGESAPQIDEPEPTRVG